MSEKNLQNKNTDDKYLQILNSVTKRQTTELDIILNFWGYDQTVKANTTTEQLKEIKTNFGISHRKVDLNKNWYNDNMLPLLVKHNDSYKAVLPNFKGQCFYYEGKKRKWITEENSYQFDTKGFCFYKGFGNEKITKSGLFMYMLSCVKKSEYFLVLFMSLLSIFLSVLYTHIQHHIFQNLIPSGSRSYILSVIAFLIGLALNMFVVNLIKGVISGNIPLIINANLQGAIIDRLLNIKPYFFSEKHSGRLGQNITRFSDVSNMFSREMIATKISFVLSFIYIGASAIYVKEFTVYLLLLFLTTVIMYSVNALLFQKYTKKLYDHSNKMTGFAYELFGGMENVKLNNADKIMLNRWNEYYIETLRAQNKPFYLKYYNAIYALVSAIFTVCIYIVGINTNIGAANFITFMALYGMFVSSLMGVSKVFLMIVKYNTSFERIKEFLLAETEETKLKAELKSIEKGIYFSNVSFKYAGSDKDVFTGLSISFPKGKKIGIVGKSGCGKSTLLKLLLGFEKPNSGHIFIDDTDINEINLKSFRKNLGVILQTTKLIPADIYSNITLTRPSATDEDVNRVIEAVGLKETIDKMPMGLSTYVSEENMSISAGQKQRILLARAIIGNPSILILDEATNALDNLTQAAVTRHIERTDTTAVIVAHRLSTIKQCDNIILLDKGKIAEKGTYDELIAKNGKFYELIKNQL